MHITATPLHWLVWSQSRKGKQIHCVGEEDGESVLGSLSMANMRCLWQSCAATESKMWSRPTSSSPSWIVVGGLRLGEDVTSPFLLPVCFRHYSKHLNLWWKLTTEDSGPVTPVSPAASLHTVARKRVYSIRHNSYNFRRSLVIFGHKPSWYFSVLKIEN